MGARNDAVLVTVLELEASAVALTVGATLSGCRSVH